MDLGLRGKIVLVTGGAKGIGAATVKAFLAEDCKIVLVDRDAEAGLVLVKYSGSKARFTNKISLFFEILSQFLLFVHWIKCFSSYLFYQI